MRSLSRIPKVQGAFLALEIYICPYFRRKRASTICRCASQHCSNSEGMVAKPNVCGNFSKLKITQWLEIILKSSLQDAFQLFGEWLANYFVSWRWDLGFLFDFWNYFICENEIFDPIDTNIPFSIFLGNIFDISYFSRQGNLATCLPVFLGGTGGPCEDPGSINEIE